MTRVLVTGASGFVGSILCDVLAREGHTVRAAVRSATIPLSQGVTERAVVGDIGGNTDWSAALTEVDLIVHAAARAHILGDPAHNAGLYLETNARGAERLARAAASAGVRRMVYLSSVKVNGEGTAPGQSYSATDNPRPLDAYGASKWEGEQRLLDVAAATPLEVAIVRPPLVYGPGVRANFLRLMRWVDRGVPLPLGSVDNRRSLVSVWTLCDLLVRLLSHPAAAGNCWMVSDGEDLSTPELIRRIARAMRRPARLLPIPVTLLRAGGAILGRRDEIERLCGSLVVNVAPTREVLGWAPQLSLDDALARTVAAYHRARSNREGS